MSYHRFNNLAELLNGDLNGKIGRGIFSKYLMKKKCNCYLPSKVNGKCVYKCKCSMCDAIYIGNTQQTFKKIMDSHFYDLLRLIKNGQKSESFAAHSEQNFNTTTSHTYLDEYISFKVVNQLKPIGAMETFTKTKCNILMQERLTILQNICDKTVTFINKNLDIYGACRHKTTFH